MSKPGQLGLVVLALGLLVAALPVILPCSAFGGCGDGQALLLYPFLGLPIAALGFVICAGSLIAGLIGPARHDVKDDQEGT